MFSLSKMCQNTLRNPRGVVEVGMQLMKYLKKTQSCGIFISSEEGPLEIFTDSRFGPGGQDSQGTVIVLGWDPLCGSQDVKL